MNKVIIVIVNGAAEAGKTTVQGMIVGRYYDTYNIKIQSSVDLMYKVYQMLGWNGIKDDKFRNDMHILKNMYINNCDGPTRDIIIEAIKFIGNECRDTVIFYDIREEEEINKLISLVKPLNVIGIYCKTMLVRRLQVEDIVHNNYADDNVLNENIKYNIIVDNSGDINLLEQNIPNIFKQIMEV